MLVKLFKFRVLFLLSAVFLLCQCTKTVNSSEPAPLVQKKVASPYKLPVATYLSMAQEKEGEERQQLLISAAGRLISEGQWSQGQAILAQTDGLTDSQFKEKNLLLAQVDVIRDRPAAALDKLATIKESSQLSLYHQIQFHELLAQSYRTAGHHTASISERIALESLLTDQKSQLNNQRALWLTLINLPEAELNTLAAEAASQSELQGWVELAKISRKYRDNPKSLLATLDQWQSRFNRHPANNILPNPLDSITNKMIQKPQKIALMLPLSGALSGPGKAIEDGFMAAFRANNQDNTLEVKVYDTDKEEVAALYQKAISEGAQFVVGPLTKNHVAIIAAMDHPVPTLLLNDLGKEAQDNSYLFGLSPVNEAVEVALRAKSKGYRKALIIAPGTDWGKEVSQAFSKQWIEDGGQIIDSLDYAANDDINDKIRDFLQITESQKREKGLKQILGEKIQSLVSRRQDFDMIFLLAYPSKARQIMPLLKYYYAGDMPVYATSSVYSGSADPIRDKDLEGLIFCDIPWVFSHQVGKRNWPEQFNSYNRLYALGMDSYALSAQLNQLILFPADGSMEANGTLYLKPSQQVARVFEWGQFKQGLAHSLG